MSHTCELCMRAFACPTSLSVHYSVYHRDQKAKGVCPHCEKVLTRSDSLYRHILNIHYKQKKYKCPICKRAFGTSYNMKQHMFSHSDVRTFCCSKCQKTYKTKRNLNSHLRNSHQPDLGHAKTTIDGSTLNDIPSPVSSETKGNALKALNYDHHTNVRGDCALTHDDETFYDKVWEKHDVSMYKIKEHKMNCKSNTDDIKSMKSDFIVEEPPIVYILEDS